MKRLLFILIVITKCDVLTAQFGATTGSLGFVYSDISYPSDKDVENGNDAKIGLTGSIGMEYMVPKINWLVLELNLVYQERKALEVFTFPIENQFPAESSTLTLANYPTSPQSDDFDDYNYKHFPNFKYISAEFIVDFRFGNKLSFDLGVGIFGGYLLNHKQNQVDRYDLIDEVQYQFEPPFNASGTVKYNRYDFGAVPKFSIAYSTTRKTKVGASIKAYQSLIRLNDTLVWPKALHFNMRWVAYIGSLNLIITI